MNTSISLHFRAFLTSSIGKKFVVALTGISLSGFLLEHCIGNLLLLHPNPDVYLQYAAFMGANMLIRILEIGLFLGFGLHIFSALYVQAENHAARPTRYSTQKRSAQSWFSRAMLFSGSVVFVFFVVHLGRFFVPHKILHTSRMDLYQDARLAFSQPMYVALYVIAMIFLAVHLVHGVQSALQTFGLKSARTAGFISVVGYCFAVIIPGLLALIPIWIYCIS